ncbi:hypothetical protein C8034_v007793 [Colletotrichum sidae]|uniref:Uncharacterized protein n=1 Tax=Colletotrichum sidae TaxID=1347389 RepID=A0A4R8T388_9PEZI|nr:hypothetical protein C8034_v007793 [Colletotrichum sidae]
MTMNRQHVRQTRKAGRESVPPPPAQARTLDLAIDAEAFPPDTDSVVKLELALGPRDQRTNHQAPPTVRPSIFWEFAQEHTPSEGSATSDTVFPHIKCASSTGNDPRAHEVTANRRMALPS